MEVESNMSTPERPLAMMKRICVIVFHSNNKIIDVYVFLSQDVM